MRPLMEPLLTPKEAARFLRKAVCTIYRYVDEGKLPYRKIGNELRFLREEIERLADAKEKYKNKIESKFLKENLQNRLTKKPPLDIDGTKGGFSMARSKRSRRNFYGYGSVYVRLTSDGIPRYYIDFRDKSGNRIQRLVKHATCWEEGHEALRTAVLKEHYAACGIKEEKRIRLRMAVEMFLENYSKVNKRSWKDDFWRLGKCCEFFGNVYLDELSPLDMERLKSFLLKEGRSRSTVNRHLAIMMRLYNVLSEWGYGSQNPVKGVKFFSEKDTLRQRIF